MNLKDVLLCGFVTFLEKTMFFHMFSNGLWFSETTLPEILKKEKRKRILFAHKVCLLHISPANNTCFPLYLFSFYIVRSSHLISVLYNVHPFLNEFNILQ